MQISSAAAVAAAVVQSEGYKPREERGWEEFHPNLDIDGTFMVFHAEDVDGTAKSIPGTPSGYVMGIDHNDAGSPLKDPNIASGSVANTPTAQANSAVISALGIIPGTPTRRRSNRPRDSYFPHRGEFGGTPRTPKILPIHNQTPKERLDLKLPSYRKTDRILLFESKTFGQARYVDKAMMNVGYQESDNYIRPERRLIKATDANIEDEADHAAVAKVDGETVPHGHTLGRVEYDMDEQDDMWLEAYNAQRKSVGWNPVTREVFEITITKIEKEWHALEKRIPKPNPKPPQTHRPRSSSAAAVNGEPQAGEEQDSKCAICDDGDCENTNAIVFCDGCDLAVHQECYGVPFIPEGQWLCRKCQLIGRGVPVSPLPYPASLIII
jgi:NuA3 HAT complex component NTO1